MRHECRSPYVKTFRRSAVVWQLLTEHLLSFRAQPNFHKPSKCPSSNANRLESSYFSSFKLFNLSAPFLKLLKCATARTSHAKVIVKPARVLKFDFFSAKRFGEVLTGDPNAPAGGLGPPIPPLYLCKNLRIVWKGLRRRFLWFDPDFYFNRSSPHLQ